MANHPYSTDSPLVSVIIPAYNAERFIERTLRSVITQTYQHIEVIVVDDGSQDQTAEIVQSMAQQDERIRLLQQPNSGVAAARNLAIERSNGTFIAPIDADDIWYPQNLEKQVQCLLQADPSVGLVYSWSVEIDENDNLTPKTFTSRVKGDVFTTLLLIYFIGNASSTLIRRTCLDEVGGYNTNFRAQHAQGCEDWDLYLRIAASYQFEVVPELLVGYRKLTNSMSGNYSMMAKSLGLIWQSIERKHPGIPGAIRRLSVSNFYIYLAYENNKRDKPAATFYWIRRSLKENPVSPFFRIVFYSVVLSSSLALLTQSINARIRPGRPSRFPLQDRQPKKEKRVTTLEELSRPKFIDVRSVVEQTLHTLALKAFGTSDDWRC